MGKADAAIEKDVDKITDADDEEHFRATDEYVDTFNPRTAEALVKVALAAQAFDGGVNPTWQHYSNMRDALSTLTAAMEDNSNVG